MQPQGPIALVNANDRENRGIGKREAKFHRADFPVGSSFSSIQSEALIRLG